MALRSLNELLEVMRRLRGADGCPWDRAQTFASLVPHTLEEAYEVADAVQRGDTVGLREELGDLLFQIVFYARIAEEAGDFDFDAVAAGIAGKLIRRHPHVFGNAPTGDTDAQAAAWEAHKAAERRHKGGDKSALAGVAAALPALIRAVKLQDRAARDGFDWPDVQDVLDKIDEEIAELRAEISGSNPARIEHELGDILLAVSNLARHLDIDPETALRRANGRFEQRYARMESIAAARGEDFPDLSLEEMEALWQQAKREIADG
jgi:nucleoside triphosphate diphosphatase